MLKNVVPFRLAGKWPYDAEALHAQLAKHPARACGALEMRTSGWAPPRGGDALVMAIDGHYQITLRLEEKVLPSTVVKKELEKAIQEFTERTGHRPGAKMKKQLKEKVIDELLPRAFIRDRQIPVWIYPKGRWIGVGISSVTKAEEAIAILIRSLEAMPVIHQVRTAQSPAFTMRNWLANDNPPCSFTIDDQCELTDEDKGTIKYARHSLDGVDMQHHLTTGKLPKRLGMTFDDSISFVVTDDLALTKLKLTDTTQADVKNSGDDFAEATFVMIASEVARVLDELIAACGGFAVETGTENGEQVSAGPEIAAPDMEEAAPA
jgi:recombination associated protein RdgC